MRASLPAPFRVSACAELRTSINSMEQIGIRPFVSNATNQQKRGSAVCVAPLRQGRAGRP
eukprot:m.324808 g.324808  ORF g.324808 m.324808 type:complete len:60 (-) comp55543_c0_seq10:63-242(-)